MIDWRDVSLLGIDVGFSARGRTTGIAQYRFGTPARLDCVRTGPDHRSAVLSEAQGFDAIAIDGPIVSNDSADAPMIRECERALARKPFARNCKAGFSHFGTGLLLRQAATQVAGEMAIRRRHEAVPIVEAFPNAFLGVMLEQSVIDSLRPIARGTKSDLFYQCAVTGGGFERLFAHLDWNDPALRSQINALAQDATRAAHEHRAAMVCLLTAACTLRPDATYVGNAVDGFICLPPLTLWADWAREALGT